LCLGGAAITVAKKKARVVWADAPAEHDYPAAAAYLGLLAGPDLVQVLTALLSQAPTVHHRANDLLRAARLPLLDGGDPEVAKDLKKIDAREALSPVLLIRGDLACGHPLQVADGYHRICASYAVDEDIEIACRIVALPAVAV
jgi:hypothetical protein